MKQEKPRKPQFSLDLDRELRDLLQAALAHNPVITSRAAYVRHAIYKTATEELHIKRPSMRPITPKPDA